MEQVQEPITETDPRFPSGRWLGFFMQKHVRPGRHQMEMRLTFRNQVITGEGRDLVGPFNIKGRYNTADGKCHWIKRYDGKHDVFYNGYNEGKGIWGIWEIATDGLRGGFHVWPEGMEDPTKPTMSEEADIPAPYFENVKIGEEELVPAIVR